MKILLLLIFITGPVHASVEEVKDMGSWYVNLNYLPSDIVLDHREQSSSTGFESPNRKLRMHRHMLNISLEKEVMSNWPLSLSISPTIGFSFGETDKANDSNSFKESLAGYQLGFGGSINYNAFTKTTKIQPFVGLSVLSVTDTFFLRYEEVDSTERSREIETEQTYNLSIATIGVRFLNLKDMISTLAISTYQYDNLKTKTEASKGDEKYSLDEFADVRRDNVSIQIGFGFIL